MAIDRVARQKNREQDARLDELEARVDEQDAVLRTHAELVTGLESRADALEAARLINEGAITAQAQDLAKLNARVDSLGARVTALEQPTPEPEPEPEPEPSTWRTLLDLSRRSAWDGIHESAPGAEISDQSDGSIRLYKPQSGERCEISHHDERIKNGGTYRYSWDLRIDPITRFSTDGSGTDTINQQHGDEKSGYGGGLTVRASDKKLILRVKGGERLSTSGSQRYEYESDGKGGSDAEPKENVEVGTIKVGERQKIVVEARWSKVWDGYVRVSLDGGPWVGVKDVPTMCEPANVQMFYLGWYDSGGAVPKDMKVWNAKVEVPA